MIWQDKSRSWVIIRDHNLVFVLWLGWAAFEVYTGLSLGSLCIIHPLLGVCPGCGLTHDLERLLTLQHPEGHLIYLVMGLFILNMLSSIECAYVAHLRGGAPYP
ncbi:MAG: hypothetical protein EBZ48_02845 [Proteobacteria bacterium]|nr:hypothetical protein [Pseudomonadota bacterium]